MSEMIRATSCANLSSVTTIRFKTLARAPKVPSSFIRSRASSRSICPTDIAPPPGADRGSPITGSLPQCACSRSPPPSPVACQECLGLFGAPGARRVEGDLLAAGPGSQHGVQDLPRPFGLVRADEERRVAEHEVEEEPLVSIRDLLQESGSVQQVHVHGANPKAPARDLRPYPHRDPLLGLDAHHQDVRLQPLSLCAGKRRVGSRLELDGDLRRPLREPFARPHVERYPRPPPVVYVQLERHVGLGHRVGGYTLLLAVTRNLLAPYPARGVLAAHGVA